MFFLTSPFSKIVSKLERNEARQYIYVYIYIKIMMMQATCVDRLDVLKWLKHFFCSGKAVNLHN